MSKKMIGIEIGSDSIKIAQVKNGKVLNIAVESLPEHMVSNGRVTAPAAMSHFLKRMLKYYKIRGRECAFVIPPQFVVSQRVTLPLMTEAELKLNLPYEFKDYVGRNSDDYEYDYIVSDIRGNMMDLYAAAVRKDYIEDYYDIFKLAGLTLRMAMPAEMAWLNVILNAKNAPNSLCIIDIGHEKTHINIYQNGHFVMGKDIEYAGQLFDETIAQELDVDTYAARSFKESNTDHIQSNEVLKQPFGAVAIEVMKTLTFYSYSNGTDKEPLRDMYLCGGSANIEILRTAIVKATDLVPHHVAKLLDIDEELIPLAIRCGLAAGAAMQKE